MENIQKIITIIGGVYSLLVVLNFINNKFSIGAKIVFSKNLKAIKHLEANPTKELRYYFNSSEQVQLYSAWLLTKGGLLVPSARKDRCGMILDTARNYMTDRDSRATSQPFSTYFYTISSAKTKA